MTKVKVKKLLSALKTDKSPGPDGMHLGLLLHNTGDEVAKPLTLTFDKWYTEGELPWDWKQANIRVHIIAQRANRYIVAFHIAISYDFTGCCM